MTCLTGFFVRILERRRGRISLNQLQDMRELEFPVPSLHDLGPQNEECEQVSVMNENMMKRLAVVSKVLKVHVLLVFIYIKLIYLFIFFDSCTFYVFSNILAVQLYLHLHSIKK
jgi:hypothetical protein